MDVLFADNLSKIPFIKHGFFGRNGGYSFGIFDSLNVGINRGDDNQNVFKNREKIANFFGQQTLFIPKQIHSDKVYVVEDIADENKECDAVITNKPNFLIGVNTADCVPMLLCDMKKRYIAVVHSGWRGALSGVVENTITNMQSLGCDDIVCAIGPCISEQSFEVGDEVLNKVDQKYVRNRHFDLSSYVSDKLLCLGITNFVKITVDTFSNNRYFSYRRNTVVHKIQTCGVQFSGIAIVENDNE